MLGRRIYEIRTSLGLNQVQLAQKLNITKQTVSNWENDNIQPSIEMLVRLSKVLGVSTDYLLGLDSVPRISVENLPNEVLAHLTLLVHDLQNAMK